MTSVFNSVALVATAITVMAQPASAWRASNWHDVYPLGDGVIEVVSEPGSGPAQFWCAVADYALKQDRVASNQRIYVQQPIGPSVNKPGYKAVRFSYTAPEGVDTSKSWTQSFRTPGKNKTAAAAVQYCRDDVGEGIDWNLP